MRWRELGPALMGVLIFFIVGGAGLVITATVNPPPEYVDVMVVISTVMGTVAGVLTYFTLWHPESE